MAHKMRMDEIKAQAELEKAQATNVKNQTNVQINEGLPFGQGNYGKLMDKLLKDVWWRATRAKNSILVHEKECRALENNF